MSKGRPFGSTPKQGEVKAVIDKVAMERCVSPDAIINGRDRVCSTPARHEVWRRLHSAGYSPTSIARAWGCNHVTVIDAVLGRSRARQVVRRDSYPQAALLTVETDSSRRRSCSEAQ